MDIIEEIKQFVYEEHQKPDTHYGAEPYENHILPVVAYAEKLARQHGADEEVVVLAAWLHDIGSLRHGRKDHHLTGAKIAENKLKELGYPEDKIKLVKACITNHRGSQKLERNTIEEKIVAEADALSNFDNLPGLFKAAFIYENKTQSEAQISVREKLERKWNKLHFPESRQLVKNKYEAIKLLLN